MTSSTPTELSIEERVRLLATRGINTQWGKQQWGKVPFAGERWDPLTGKSLFIRTGKKTRTTARNDDDRYISHVGTPRQQKKNRGHN